MIANGDKKGSKGSNAKIKKGQFEKGINNKKKNWKEKKKRKAHYVRFRAGARELEIEGLLNLLIRIGSDNFG